MAAIDSLNQFGNAVIERAQRNLGATRSVNGKKRRAVASGKLKAGLRFSAKVDVKKGIASISFGADPSLGIYPEVVEYGRGRGKTPPPTGPIKEWIKTKRIRARDEKGRVLKQTDARVNGLAYVISRKIGKEGIPALYYYRDALRDEINASGNQFIKTLGDKIVEAHVSKFSKSTITIK